MGLYKIAFKIDIFFIHYSYYSFRLLIKFGNIHKVVCSQRMFRFKGIVIDFSVQSTQRASQTTDSLK